MSSELILFIPLAILAILSAVAMLFSTNAVYAALFLILNFASVAIFYLILSAPFIALAQVTVYAGAIMVLFLFVIMLLNAERTGRTPAAWWLQPLALVLGLILLVEALYFVFSQRGVFPVGGATSSAFGDPVHIGEVLFSQYLVPFEVTSVLLLTALIGAIVLSRRRT